MQDFKSVFNYNSVLSDIILRIKQCGVKFHEVEFLKKILSTFHTSNIMLSSNIGSVSIRRTWSWPMSSWPSSKLINYYSIIMIWDLLTLRHFLKKMLNQIIFGRSKGRESWLENFFFQMNDVRYNHSRSNPRKRILLNLNHDKVKSL